MVDRACDVTSAFHLKWQRFGSKTERDWAPNDALCSHKIHSNWRIVWNANYCFNEKPRRMCFLHVRVNVLSVDGASPVQHTAKTKRKKCKNLMNLKEWITPAWLWIRFKRCYISATSPIKPHQRHLVILCHSMTSKLCFERFWTIWKILKESQGDPIYKTDDNSLSKVRCVRATGVFGMRKKQHEATKSQPRRIHYDAHRRQGAEKQWHIKQREAFSFFLMIG